MANRIKGISFLNPVDVEEGYLKKCAEYAIAHGVKHFELIGPTHSPVRGNCDGMIFYRKYSQFNEGKDAEYIRYCERVVNEALDMVSAHGIKSYYWHHELEIPLAFDEVYPEIHNEDGDVEVTHPLIKDFLENKIEDFFFTYPKMDGIVLTLHETRIPLLKLKNQKLDKVERVKYVTEILYEACKKLGKELIVRPFASMASDYDDLMTAYERIGTDLVVCDKWTQYDWSLTMPHNDFFNRIKNPLMVETDIFGEYFGKGFLPLMLKDHITEKFAYCEGYEPRGYVSRIDRGGFIPFDTPNEVNLEIMDACLDGRDVDEAIDAFFAREYGEYGPDVRALMENTEDIQIMMFYINRVEFNMLSLFPSRSYLITAQKIEMFRDNPELEPTAWYIPKNYVRPPLEELTETKKEAIRLAAAKLEELRRLEGKLTKEKYHGLYTRFMNLFLAARLWRELTRVCMDLACYYEKKDEAYIDDMRAAMQKLLIYDKDGAAILGDEYYITALARPVLDKKSGKMVKKSSVVTFVEQMTESLECEIKAIREIEAINPTDYVIAGGINERHGLKKEINFSSSHVIGGGVCRLAGSARGKAWSVVKAHGWFSYDVAVKPNEKNVITVTAGGFDSEHVDLAVTVGAERHVFKEVSDGRVSFDIEYVAGDSDTVTVRIDKITEFSPVVYTIVVK